MEYYCFFLWYADKKYSICHLCHKHGIRDKKKTDNC